jgi:hypothetical protein
MKERMRFIDLARAIWTTIACCLSNQTLAAEFEASSNSFYEFRVVSIKGPLVYGDFERFKEVVTGSDRAIIVLDSLGGKLGPAIKIAEYVRASGFVTYVESSGECSSACSVIWLSGRRKFIEMGGIIGFHAPVQEVGGVQKSAPEISHALLGWAFGSLGLPEEVLMRIYENDPIDIKEHDFASLGRMGFDFTTVEENSLTMTAQAMTDELSSSEMGITLSSLTALTAETDSYANIQVMSEQGLGESLASGTVIRLNSPEQERQNKNMGFLEAANSLELVIRNASELTLKGVILSCKLCECEPKSYMSVLFSRHLKGGEMGREAFSSQAREQISEEYGEQVDCLKVIAAYH